MFKQIVNPETGRKVNVNGLIGKRVLKKYLIQLGGGCISDSDCSPSKGRKRICNSSSSCSGSSGTISSGAQITDFSPR